LGLGRICGLAPNWLTGARNRRLDKEVPRRYRSKAGPAFDAGTIKNGAHAESVWTPRTCQAPMGPLGSRPNPPSAVKGSWAGDPSPQGHTIGLERDRVHWPAGDGNDSIGPVLPASAIRLHAESARQRCTSGLRLIYTSLFSAAIKPFSIRTYKTPQTD